MYIKYYEIFEQFAHYVPPKLREAFKQVGMNLKIKQNLKYVSENKKQVLKKLKDKIKRGEKLNVAFYIYDETKWKCQSVYDLMEKNEFFTPWIFVSKNCAPDLNFNYQKPEVLHSVYEFFEKRGMRVKYAYDFEKNDYISFEDMEPGPDIIFYCHPWYVYKTQGPVMASKYALTYYIPYSVSSSMGVQEYYLRFYLYVETQYVLNNLIKEYFASHMANNGENLKAVGHPVLDYFYLNQGKEFEDKRTIIYAPHFSVTDNTTLKWGTFLSMGEFVLEWAKAHPEFKYVFKPHPCLWEFLRSNNLWSEDRLRTYWNEWSNIGQVNESGDYLNMFMESCAMITDCGSFKTEYFMTQKPQIFLKSENGVPFNPSAEKINQTCYKAESTEELANILDDVLIKGNDYKRSERAKLYNECGYAHNYAAQKIIDDIVVTLLEA